MNFNKKHYRRNISVLKGLSSITLIFLVIWIACSVFWRDKVADTEDKDVHKEAKRAHEISIVNSVFEGSDEKGISYKVASNTVLKTGADSYALGSVSGRYEAGTSGVNLKAHSGEMDDGKKLLKLAYDVILEYSEFLLKTDHMNIDLETMAADNDDKVNVLYRNSTITADKFSANSEANRVHFHGHVSTHLKMSDF